MKMMRGGSKAPRMKTWTCMEGGSNETTVKMMRGGIDASRMKTLIFTKGD